MAHGVPLYGMVLQLHQRKKMTRALFLFCTDVFSCVAATVCHYFECNSIICYFDEQNIRYVLLTATTLFVCMYALHLADVVFPAVLVVRFPFPATYTVTSHPVNTGRPFNITKCFRYSRLHTRM